MADIGTDISRAARILRDGGLVAIPTETVYGLAANALNKSAVARIFEAKNRPFFDPLIVHISGISELEKYAAEIPTTALRICEKIWPGPLTIVLKKKDIVPDIVTAGNDSVGLRVPNNPIALSLLKILDFPLAAPSANPFGYVSPTSAEHVQEQLGDKLDYILDGGPSFVGVESTIVRFTENSPEVLRLGGISPEKITELLGAVVENLHQNSNPNAPGQLDQHYSPFAKMILVKLGADIPQNLVSGKTALLRFQHLLQQFPKEIQFVLSETGNTETAAVNLFDTLRKLDRESYTLIIAEEVPAHGLGRAINDRLRRAAAKS